MIRSTNERFMLVLKAARGAGQPIGIAEELATASTYLNPFTMELIEAIEASEMINQISVIDSAVCDSVDIAVTCNFPSVFQALISGYNAKCARSDMLVWDEHILRKKPSERLSVCGPQSVSQDVWEALNRLAAKTYVPATDESRLAGAGAGLTDND